MPLCARCEQRSDPRGRGYDIAVLRSTTCEFCRIVYQGLVSVLSSVGLMEKSYPTFPALSREDGSRFQVHVQSHHAIVSFYCSWGTTCPWGILSPHRDITTVDYEGEGSFQTALGWIEDCTTHHHCSDVTALPTLPTRVVDTGLLGGPVRVVDGASRKERYVCLSHCWGQERPLMTTSQTLESHKNGISWASIPPTFQDAISITRRLCVQYIWIDSLCIIQDSVEDWESESSKMADIYRNSHVTIAGASSKDSRDGLGLNRPRQEGTTLKGTTSSGKPYSIRVQCAIQSHCPIDKKTPKDGIQHPIPPTTSIKDDFAGVFGVFPLLTRGWVFQERLLSPRFLQFGKNELLWDCRESMLCECGQRPPDLPFNQVTIKSGDGELLPYKWRKIAGFYCALNLTYPKDKLPALSGLAKQVREQKGGATYLAGLWSDSLDLDLVWIPYGPENPRADEYIAPSWSWAGVGRRIIYPSLWRAKEERPSVKVLDVYFEKIHAACTPSSTDPTGTVAGGMLVLKGALSAISVHGPPGHGRAGEFRHGDTPFFLCTSREHDSILSNWRPRLVGKNNIYSFRLTRVEISEDNIYFLVLEAREIIHVEFSLLLERVDEGSDVFRRIGLLADGRFIDGHHGDVNSWRKDPSCFESTTELTTVTII